MNNGGAVGADHGAMPGTEYTLQGAYISDGDYCIAPRDSSKDETKRDRELTFRRHNALPANGVAQP